MNKIILLIILTLSVIGCISTNPPTAKQLLNIEKVCIEGHIYFKGNAVYEGYFGLKVDDDGKPIKCTEKVGK